ncbi:MAG: OsmC family peroxiredoxin [Verrucomicrobia bacterium]|nr:MAG: OsmC family peroxiredoxin [Verrucomicrobiota bacterium]
MAEHTAQVLWQRPPDAPFTDNRYSRRHVWRFDGGVEVPASSTPAMLPPPLSAIDAVDPEEAFVAALSSCHMLWFLAIAARKGYIVDAYEDHAVGHMGRNSAGRTAMVRVVLRPKVTFAGENRPDADALKELHHQAHEQCFIAHSVTSEVSIEPQANA